MHLLVNKELLGSVNTAINLSYFCYFSAFGLTQKKSFVDDLSDVDDLFNGPSDCSMFNLNPEKGIILNNNMFPISIFQTSIVCPGMAPR